MHMMISSGMRAPFALRFTASFVVVFVAVLALVSCRSGVAAGVVYFGEKWIPCGPEYNIVKADEGRTWRVLDNQGKLLFAKSFTDEDVRLSRKRIEYSDGAMYMRRIGEDWRTETISRLEADGTELPGIEVERLTRFLVSEEMGVLLTYGPTPGADGKSTGCYYFKAYSLETGAPIEGDLPTTWIWQPLVLAGSGSSRLWLVWRMGKGDEEKGIFLVGYDKQLKEVTRKKLSDLEYVTTIAPPRVDFASLNDGLVWGVITSPGKAKTLFVYDEATGELKKAPLDLEESTPLRGAMLSDTLVMWGGETVVFFDPSEMKEMTRPGHQFVDHHRMTEAGAVLSDNKIALAYVDRYRKHLRPTKLLVYDAAGELVEKAEVKSDWLEHLKLVSKGREVLVFCRSYTARVALEQENEEPQNDEP